MRYFMLLMTLFFIACSNRVEIIERRIVVKQPSQGQNIITPIYGEDRSGVDVKPKKSSNTTSIQPSINAYKNAHKSTNIKIQQNIPSNNLQANNLKASQNPNDKLSVYFDFNSYKLKAKADEKLKNFKKTSSYLLLQGNCDEVGSEQYNYNLGLKRAKSVRQALLKLGFDANKIFIKSFGKTKPICFEDTKICHAKNRRVDLVLAK